MEIVKLEVQAIETVIADVANHQQRELNDLELSIVGGGVGDISLG